MDAERFVRLGDRYKTPLLFEARKEPGVSLPGLLATMGVFAYFFTLLKKVTRTQAIAVRNTLLKNLDTC